jgi:hypothetical protein
VILKQCPLSTAPGILGRVFTIFSALCAFFIFSLMAEHGYAGVAMVGDGATDMDAKPPASVFVGFGGVVVRDSVKAGADWFVSDFAAMTAALKE